MERNIHWNIRNCTWKLVVNIGQGRRWSSFQVSNQIAQGSCCGGGKLFKTVEDFVNSLHLAVDSHPLGTLAKPIQLLTLVSVRFDIGPPHRVIIAHDEQHNR